jgi:hypothetical protein
MSSRGPSRITHTPSPRTCCSCSGTSSSRPSARLRPHRSRAMDEPKEKLT